MNLQDIEREAREEVAEERHREAVEAAKARIRARRGRSFWSRLFPFRIKIERT